MVERSESSTGWEEAAAVGPAVDLERLVEDLEACVESSKQVMNHAVWVDMDEFYDLTRRIRTNLPDEIRRATRVTREGNRILDDAREEARRMLDESRSEADHILRTAREEAERIIEAGEIQRVASERAAQIVGQAEQRAEQVRTGANAYAREVLSSLEATIQRLQQAIDDGKAQLA
jgi:hypothetical protein